MTSSSPSSTKHLNPVTVTMIVIIVILLAVIAGLLALRSGSSRTTSATATPAPQATSTPTPQATATAQAEETSAPTVTDTEVLEVMHAEMKRDPADPRAKGEPDAAVVMVVYSDFACPYCTQFAQQVEPQLNDLLEDGTLRIEWRDLAQITETSPLAAQAGIAAANQGKFWEFHDAMYAAADPSDHPVYTEDSLVAMAQEVGISDLETFRADMLAPETAQQVVDAKDHAYSLGIQGTPFMIVGDTVISGLRPEAYVRATVLEQAALAQG